MVTVFDVAAYLLERRTPLSAMQLQKLVYYGQAWHLAWYGEPLFRESLRAWDGGPVCGELFNEHRGQRVVHGLSHGDSTRLEGRARQTLEAVLGFYGDFPGDWLSELSHRERPWLDARAAAGAERSPLITHEAMRACYGSVARAPGEIPEPYRRGVELVMSLSPEELADLVTDQPAGVSIEDELAFLEGRGPDPWPT